MNTTNLQAVDVVSLRAAACVSSRTCGGCCKHLPKAKPSAGSVPCCSALCAVQIARWFGARS